MDRMRQFLATIRADHAARAVLLLLLAPAVGLAIWLDTRPSAPCDEDSGCPDLATLRDGGILEEAYHIVDRHGEALVDVGGVRRRWTPLDRLPPRVPQSWIAVEDRRFREHDGLDGWSMARAAAANLADRGVAEGASTIPMQLARVLWPATVRRMGRWERKFFELRMAPRLVEELGHDRVLELYLNSIYLGDGVYGVGAAAQHYYGVSPAELTDGQLATLVGMTKTPERYHPGAHPAAARTRRNVVLGVLGERGLLTPREVARARASAVEVTGEEPVGYGRSYVTAAVRRELSRVAPELVGEEGLTIFTTVDPEAQAAASETMKAHLKAVEAGKFGAYQGGAQPAQGGAILLESSTGEILALVGGRDFGTTELIRPLQTRRPVGSLTKPIILATMLRKGMTTAQPLSTAAIALETGSGTWRPRDHVKRAYLLPREMVVESSNRAAVRLGRSVGISAFSAFAHTLGVSGNVPPYPSSLLGSFDASLAEMTDAYATFENGGYQVDAHLIRRVQDTRGGTLWERPLDTPRERLMRADQAHLVLDAMRGVVDEGTGWRVRRHVQGPAAGKTATTTDGADAWFVGARPGITAGVWIGLDRPGPVAEGGSGGRLAAPLWGRWMQKLEAMDLGTGVWHRPEGLVLTPVRSVLRGDGPVVCWGEGGKAHLVQREHVLAIPPCASRLADIRPDRATPPWDRSDMVAPESIRLRSQPASTRPPG